MIILFLIFANIIFAVLNIAMYKIGFHYDKFDHAWLHVLKVLGFIPIMNIATLIISIIILGVQTIPSIIEFYSNLYD